MRVYFLRKEQEDLSLDRVLPGVCQPMIFPTERTKQGQLRFPGSAVSALTLYRVHDHQILNISTKLSQTGASQLLSKKMKIDESNPISWQQCQSLLFLLPVGTKCSWILPVNQGIFKFFFFGDSFVSCPLSPGKVPSQLPVLLTQSLLCLLPHKYLQFKATVVPSTNRRGCSSESSVPSAFGSRGSVPQARPNSPWAEGQRGGGPTNEELWGECAKYEGSGELME